MKTPERYRDTRYSSNDDGNNGLFFVKRKGKTLKVICSDGMDWEHVSVSLDSRCPTWEEMCFVKSLFWDDEETVVQFHPPKSQYVNQHKFCLHLWKPAGKHVETPPSILVGYK